MREVEKTLTKNSGNKNNEDSPEKKTLIVSRVVKEEIPLDDVFPIEVKRKETLINFHYALQSALDDIGVAWDDMKELLDRIKDKKITVTNKFLIHESGVITWSGIDYKETEI